MREQYKMEINKTHKSAETKKKKEAIQDQTFYPDGFFLIRESNLLLRNAFFIVEQKNTGNLKLLRKQINMRLKKKKQQCKKTGYSLQFHLPSSVFFYSSRLFFIHSKHSGSVTVIQCRQQEIKINIKIKKQVLFFLTV